MKSDNFLLNEFGFEQPMAITRHMEWLEHCAMDHLRSKYKLPENATDEQIALAKWTEHKAYGGYLSMPLCFEGDTPSSGQSGYILN